MKKYLSKILIVVFTAIVFLICFNYLYYPINLNINRFNVEYAEIIYYGDGVDEKINEKDKLDLLVKTLNELKFRKYRDMSHLAPRSGVLVIDLYDKDDNCIDSIQFYEWEYRGGESEGKERGNGTYLKVKNEDAIHDLCDEFCGDPFDRLKYK